MKILDQWTLPDGKFARVIIDDEGDRIYQVSLNGTNWLGVPMHDAVGPCLARAFEAMHELRELARKPSMYDGLVETTPVYPIPMWCGRRPPHA